MSVAVIVRRVITWPLAESYASLVSTPELVDSRTGLMTFEHTQCRSGCFGTGDLDLAVDRSVILQSGPHQQRAQGHPLYDQRCEHHAEGAENYQVPIRERGSGVTIGERQRRG